MLVVRIELWPKGVEANKRVLGLAAIALRRMTTDRKVGGYAYWLLKWSNRPANLAVPTTIPKSRIWRQGAVQGFRRLTRGPWDLLFKVLADAVAERNLDVVRALTEGE